MALDVNLMVSLEVFVIVVSLICIVSFAMHWGKNQTKVNGLIMWYFLCFVIGIVIDCIRVIIILTEVGYYPDLDFATFIVKSISTFVAFVLISEIHIVLSQYAGISRNYRVKLFRYYLIMITIICASASAIFNYTTPEVGLYDFYLYQLEPMLYLAIFLAYIPVAAVLFLRNKISD